jgi:excinuclease UvrABC ATPase subunit
VSDVSSASSSVPAPTPPKPTGQRRLYESISSYAFSDSSEVAKIIISDIEGLSGATIEFTPTERASSISVLQDTQGLSNLRLTVDPLKKIVPSSSRDIVRGRTLTVLLSKKKKGT